MQALEVFLPRIMIWVDGCPQPLVEQTLVDVAIQFCTDTDIVQRDLDAFDLVKDQRRYELDIESGLEVQRITHVVYGEDGDSPSGVPTFYDWETPRTLVLPNPSETKAGWVHVKVSVKPTRLTKRLDDTLLTDWVEAVCGGTVARLASMQGQPFTNPNNAQLGASSYQAGVNRAKYELRKKHTGQDLRVIPRPFATGRRHP